MAFPTDPRVYPPSASAQALVDEGGSNLFWSTRGTPTKNLNEYVLGEGDAIYTPQRKTFSPIPQDIELAFKVLWSGTASGKVLHACIGNEEPSALNSFSSTISMIDLQVQSDNRLILRLRIGNRGYATLVDSGAIGSNVRWIELRMRRYGWSNYTNQLEWELTGLNGARNTTLYTSSGTWNTGDSVNPRDHLQWKEWNTTSQNTVNAVDTGYGVLYFEQVDNGGSRTVTLLELEINYINQQFTIDSVFGPIVMGLPIELPDCTVAEQPNIEDGILDVTGAPFNAVNDDSTDDTAALQMMMDFAKDNAMLGVLPADATLMVTDQLHSKQMVNRRDTANAGDSKDSVDEFRGMNLHGSSEGAGGQQSIVRLEDGSSGFGSAGSPKPLFLVDTTDYDFQGFNDPPQGTIVNANYNQGLTDFEINLGDNPGAVGFDIWGAQGALSYLMTVTCTDAYAGMSNCPGSGGGVHGLDVIGPFKYGYDLSSCQPVTTLSGFHIEETTDNPIIIGRANSGTRQSCQFVGFGIKPAAGVTAVQATAIFNAQRGNLVFVDGYVEWPSVNAGNLFLDAVRPIILRNVYLKNCANIIEHNAANNVTSPNNSGWVHVREMVIPASSTAYSNGGFDTTLNAAGRDTIGSTQYDEANWIDGVRSVANIELYGTEGIAPPADLVTRHRFPDDYPNWENATTNVRTDHGGIPDGIENNTAAIDAAIAAAVPGDNIFFPRGYWRNDDTIHIPEGVSACGMGIHQTCFLYPDRPGANDPFGANDAGRALMDTVDSWERTDLMWMCLWGSFSGVNASDYNLNNYAILWQGSGHTASVQTRRNSYWGYGGFGGTSGNNQFAPYVQWTGQGYAQHWGWFQGNTFNTQAPFSMLKCFDTFGRHTFYHLNAEHCHNYPGNIFFDNCFEVFAWGLKSEANFPTLMIKNCGPTMVLGFGGNHSGFHPDGELPTAETEDWGQPDYGYNPEPGGALAWSNGQAYRNTINNASQAPYHRVTHNGELFEAITNHTAASNTEPGVGANWLQNWKNLGVKEGQIPTILTIVDTDIFYVGNMQDEPRNFGSHGTFGSGTRRDGWHIGSEINGADTDILVIPKIDRPTKWSRGIFPPILTTPEATSVGNTTATIEVTTDFVDGNSELFMVVVPVGDNPNRIRIEAGEQSDSSPASFADNLVPSVEGLQTFAQATGLTQNTRYEVLIMQDPLAVYGRQSLKVHATFTTTGGSLISATATSTIAGSLAALRFTPPAPTHRRRTIGFCG